jgi:hypothetical protein
MNNTEKNSETSRQNQEPQEPRSGIYSDLMQWMDEMLLSKGLITKERLMKQQPTQQDNTIEVTFLKRRA